MSRLLADLRGALARNIRREVEVCPASLRANAETLAALEAADVDERLLTCDEAEAETLYQRWLECYRARW